MEIQIEGLAKSFGSNKVLDGLDLDVGKGEMCVILGESGQGKSVLLKHLVGLVRPDRGRILVDGEDIVRLSERALSPVRQRFGVIFQSGGLLQSLTVGENVGMPLVELRGKRPADVRGIVAEKLELVGLAGRENQMPGTLSGGQRKRAAIARALTMEAECLLFDEPTAGLDPPMAENIDEIIVEVNRRTGATVLVVTHDLLSVDALGGTVHMLHGGRFVFSGPAGAMWDSGDPHVLEFLERERGNRQRVTGGAPPQAAP